MKTSKYHWSIILTFGAMLLLTNQSHAYYTNFLDTASNALTGAYTSLTSNPTPTRMEKQAAARIKLALRDLSKPSTSVAGDYSLFLAAALHLGPLATNSDFGPIGYGIFNAFTNEAQAEIVATGERIGALNDFVRVKRAASNQIVQAQSTLNSISALGNPQVGLLAGLRVFVKITVANRLAAIGEAHPGFAPASVVGITLEHHERGRTGTVHFDDGTQATEMDPDGTDTVSYTWTRTGLNTATLVLTHDEGGGLTSTTTVKIHFSSTTAGTFTFRSVDSDGSVNVGTGTFTFN
jgi:hypothetical protein